MSKLKKIFKKQVIDFFVESEKIKDERLINAIVYYEELLNLFCEMLECEYSPFEQDKERSTLSKDKFTAIQDTIISQYKIILDFLECHNKNNVKIFSKLDAFINNLIILAIHASKMMLIGDLPFLPIGRDKFEKFFKHIMEDLFSKFLGQLKDLNIPSIKLDNLLNFEDDSCISSFSLEGSSTQISFDLYDSITKIEDIQYISDKKVVEYFNNVLVLLKPYSVKRERCMQEVKKHYAFLKTKGKLVESIREIAKFSSTDLYPSGIYFELKYSTDVGNIFYNNTEYKFYFKYLSSWKHLDKSLTQLRWNSSIFPRINNLFDNLVNYFYRDSLKKESNFLIRRMRVKE